MRLLFLGLLPALAAAGAAADLPRLERQEAILICKTPKGYPLDNVVAAFADCHRFGPLKLGMTRGEAEAHLGKDGTAIDSAPGHWLYVLQGTKARMNTYAVIKYDAKAEVTSIQITGHKWPAAWTFADITLGDTRAALVKRLGEPPATTDVPDIGATAFDYSPDVQIEVKDGTVYSIRVMFGEGA